MFNKINTFYHLFSDPILLNSHLLTSGAQQLLSIQPQLLALQHQQQQQQQSPESHPFYRKLHHGHMEPPEMNSPPLHSRKEQMSINTFKMRNREISKRLARMSRPLNGHGDVNHQHHHHHHHQMESEPHSSDESPLVTRVPTTNGETSHSSSKPLNSESNRASPSTPKPYQPPASPSKSNIDYRAMRELLAEGDKRSESHYSMDHHQNQNQTHNGAQLKINQSLQEKLVEKTERESPQPPDNQQSHALPPSPMHFSNDSNSGDNNFDDLQSKFY